MARVVRHPNLYMERLLQQLESEGVDTVIVETYVVKALAREASREAHRKHRLVPSDSASSTI